MFDWRVFLIAPPNKSFERTARQLASHPHRPLPFGLSLKGGQPLISSVRRLRSGYPGKEKEMKKETQELSRRQMLAAMAISSLGGIANGSVINKPKGANHLVPGRKSRVVTFDAQVS